MKVKIPLFITALFIVLAAIGSFNNNVQSYTGGAPAGVSGAPGQTTCVNCHGGSATAQPGWITSNIPSTGYVPDSVYTITASVAHPSRNKFGFEVFPSHPSGASGMLILTNTMQTQLVGSGQYVTHKFGGLAGAGSKTWSFDWKAPAAGAGQITFYGAFNAANSDNSSAGDVIYTSTLQVEEDTAAIVLSVSGPSPQGSSVRAYADKASGTVRLVLDMKEKSTVEAAVYDITGKLAAKAPVGHLYPGKQQLVLQMPSGYKSGLYIVCVNTGKALLTQKIIF
jgi:hypothetical protein